jgi:hypothetical protein
MLLSFLQLTLLITVTERAGVRSRGKCERWRTKCEEGFGLQTSSLEPLTAHLHRSSSIGKRAHSAMGTFGFVTPLTPALSPLRGEGVAWCGFGQSRVVARGRGFPGVGPVNRCPFRGVQHADQVLGTASTVSHKG